ncbi:MAG: hypothetical protein AAF915_23920 [Cyanobacteria bacterium P01_D01_bin.50]
MPQSRITLSPNIQILAEDLCAITGVSNFASLFGLMLTRYGPHLKISWQVSAPEMQIPATSTDAIIAHTSSSSLLSSKKAQIPPEHEDPMITRLARLIDDF